MKKGKLIVVSGPSGVGKDTVVSEYLKLHPEDVLSVSMTSRPKRDYEIDGVHYYFRTKEGFEEEVEKGNLLEYATYNGNYYGTPKSEVLKRLEDGINVILVIEVQGARNIKNMLGKDALLIFVLPPSIEALKERLINRGTDSMEVINERLEIAEREIKENTFYDYKIINDNIEIAVKSLEDIIKNNIKE
ncbi:MAG: guanylate kinase [Bacilli bacterium]|nr:guanylate kinase [Bacilli bacterium]